jgi:hypothetical protein
MAIDDRLEKSLEFYSEELETDIPSKVVKLAIEAIPHFGSYITKLLFGDAQKRIAERAKYVFDAVRERVENLDKSKIDKKFLKSDEFMTIVTLILEQLQTTHDKVKLEMMANALANSGTVDFSADQRKELFLRIFRNLAPEHIAELQRIRAKMRAGGRYAITVKEPRDESLAILQTLAAGGLVNEHQELPQQTIPPLSRITEGELRYIGEQIFITPPQRCFNISQFGEDFLKFFANRLTNRRANSTPSKLS